MTHTLDTILEYTQPLSVLYVEDDPFVRESMSEILTMLCDHVELAEDGKTGFITYQTYHQKHGRFFDLVISDVLMPIQDGIAMSKDILELNPDQEIIIISAQDNSRDLIEIINLGISHFLLKPIQDTHLFNTLYHAGKRLAIIREKDKMTQEVHRLNEALHQKVEALEKLAREDTLTGVANRRFFYEKAEAALVKSKEDSSSLYIAVMDIDSFKQINDTYGHLVGDGVITQTAKILHSILDENSFVGRVGGDEFMMFFEDQSFEEVLKKMQQVQNAIHDLHMIRDKKITYTISIGIAQREAEDKTLDDIISKADQNLYKAKALGRDRIEY